MLSFYASGDAYVSLHRAEGLGLGMMEAMVLGKPVIATAWSGNMAFMDYRCACPVRYVLEPVHGVVPALRQEVVGPHARWATPVLQDATAWMRKLHRDPARRQRLGAAARARIDAYQRQAWGREWLDELVALREARAFLPAASGKFSQPPPT